MLCTGAEFADGLLLQPTTTRDLQTNLKYSFNIKLNNFEISLWGTMVKEFKINLYGLFCDKKSWYNFIQDIAINIYRQ